MADIGSRGDHVGAAPAAPTGGRSLLWRTSGLVAAIVLVGLFFWTQKPAFLSLGVILTMIRSMVSLGIIAMAQMLALLAGELDLAVGALYGLAANTLAAFWLGEGLAPTSMHLAWALLITVGVMLAAGAITAYCTTALRIPSFIATLGMFSIAQGIELFLGNAGNFNPQYSATPPPEGQVSFFRTLGSSELPLGIPIQVVWLVGVAIVFYVLRHKTVFGFRLAAIGENPEAATAATLKVGRYKSIVLMITALASGLAGVLDFSYTGSIGPASGLGLTFPVFAAVVIGGSSLSGGKGTVIGALLGALLLAELRTGLAVLGAGDRVQLVFVGTITIVAVALDHVTSRRQGRSFPSLRRGADATGSGETAAGAG